MAKEEHWKILYISSRVFFDFKLILSWHSMLWQGNRKDDLIGHLTSVANFSDLNNILGLGV